VETKCLLPYLFIMPSLYLRLENNYINTNGVWYSDFAKYVSLSLNLGASNSWNTQGLSRSVQGLLYLTKYSLLFFSYISCEQQISAML
jgi:hypothetical protein